MSRYIGVTDTAKLIRAALKGKFPTTKFSVRSKSYAGGASITVGWTDGPSTKEVEAVTSSYAGGRFNSMIDMAYSAYHWLLPDGTVALAGTTSDGIEAGTVDRAVKPHPDAVMVHFGSDYVFTSRKESTAFMRRAAARVIRARGLDHTPDELVVDDSTWGGWTFTDLAHRIDLGGGGSAHWLTGEIQAAAARMNADTGLRMLNSW